MKETREVKDGKFVKEEKTRIGEVDLIETRDKEKEKELSAATTVTMVRRKSRDIEITNENMTQLSPNREFVWRSCCFCCTQILVLLCTRHPSQKRRWFMAIVFFILSTYIMCIANVLTEKRSLEKKIPVLVLPDFGFDFAEKFTPFALDYPGAPDFGQYVVAGLSVIWLIFGCQHPFIVFRRFLMIHSFLFLCRACCLLGTQLPNPYQGYAIQEWGDNLLYEALLVNLRYKITRTDVFYSGHTVSMTCFALMIEYYHANTLLQRCFSVVVWIITLLTLYMIIAVKFHYTIDVIIAFQLTIFTWKLYHMATESHLVRQSLPVIDFLEGDVVVEDTYCEVFPATIYTNSNKNNKKSTPAMLKKTN